jgi:hypothetical protein
MAPTVACIAVAAAALIVASGFAVRAWRAHRRREQRRRQWSADATAFSAETLSIVQLVLTWTVDRRRANVRERPLSPMVRRRFAELTAAAMRMHDDAPSWAARSAVQHARRCLADLEREVARVSTRRRIRADAIGEPTAREDRSAVIYERADELSYAARFLAIVAGEADDDMFR